MFIHTHYFAPGVLQSSPHAMSFFEPARNRAEHVRSRSVTLHHRAYGKTRIGIFLGGSGEHSYWMERDDILGVLQDFGFGDVTIGVDHPDNPNGPRCTFSPEHLPAPG